ncbi:MAG: hypothetical protein KAU90_08750, partial [Sulfurovaceae bacterium]|nr:hypothetical protein [Sulfurovaceae bacterium]
MNNFRGKYRNEVDLKAILSTISDYKWFILLIMFLSLLTSAVYLYFTPSVYSTHSILEVKDYNKNNRATDDLLQNAFYSTNKEIDKEIEILKTFALNRKVLNEINLKTQIFIEDKHKSIEKYGNESPIEIDNVEVLDNNILGKKIQLIPRDGGYSLKIKKKYISSFFHRHVISLN